MGTSQFNEVRPITLAAQIVAADTTDFVLIQDSQQYDRRIDYVSVVNNDTIDHVVNFHLDVNGSGVGMQSVTVPAGTGIGGVAALDVFGVANPTNVLGWVLTAVVKVYAFAEVAVTSGHSIQITMMGGEL